MATDERRVYELVVWLVEYTGVAPHEILTGRSKQSVVVDLRRRAAYLLRVAGGWTYREIADVFVAYGSRTVARRAVRAADDVEILVEDARRILWENKCLK